MSAACAAEKGQTVNMYVHLATAWNIAMCSPTHKFVPTVIIKTNFFIFWFELATRCENLAPKYLNK